MNRFFNFLQKYLLCSLPFVLILMVWGSFQNQKEIGESSQVLFWVYEVMSWNLIAWFALLIVFLVLLVFHSSFRYAVLKRIANLKEQDEREEEITGRAAKTSYIAVMGLLIFLLFLSMFQLTIEPASPEMIAEGRSKTLSIGMKFNFFDSPIESDDSKGAIFQVRDIPISKTGILFLILVWQGIVYNMQVRREIRS